MSVVPASRMQTPLIKGETLLASWQPQLMLFLQRAVLLSFATTLVLAPFANLSFWQLLVAIPVFTVFFIIFKCNFYSTIRARFSIFRYRGPTFRTCIVHNSVLLFTFFFYFFCFFLNNFKVFIYILFKEFYVFFC